MSNYCEDYPCCGHTDGLGCNWTYTPEMRTYDIAHAMCDHEAGFCDAYEADDDDTCPDCGCDEDDCECPEFIMEDQWLDGSYEE